MSRQGVQTPQKGCCNACEKPIVGQVEKTFDKVVHRTIQCLKLDLKLCGLKSILDLLVKSIGSTQQLFTACLKYDICQRF